MKIYSAAALLVLATFLFAFSMISLLLAPVTTLDSRVILVLALGAAGLVLGIMALRELSAVNRLLAYSQRSQNTSTA